MVVSSIIPSQHSTCANEMRPVALISSTFSLGLNNLNGLVIPLSILSRLDILNPKGRYETWKEYRILYWLMTPHTRWQPLLTNDEYLDEGLISSIHQSRTQVRPKETTLSLFPSQPIFSPLFPHLPLLHGKHPEPWILVNHYYPHTNLSACSQLFTQHFLRLGRT